MPKLDIEKIVMQPPDEAFKKIQNFLETEKDLRKMAPDLQCTFVPEKMTGEAKGKQFKAHLKVEPQASGAKVSIVVDLPFLLTPLKGTIEGSLKKKLDRLFA